MSIHQSKIFISYARTDGEFALNLGKELRAAGADIWLDSLDIGPGERWDDTIEEALTACESFLIVLSPASVESDNVKDELSFALEEKKQIIPVLYQNCQPPFRIRRIQYSDFTSDYNKGLEQLLNALDSKQPQKPLTKIDVKEKAKGTTPEATKEIEPQQEPENYSEPLERKKISVNRKLALIGLLFVLMLSAGIFWINIDMTPLTSQEEKPPAESPGKIGSQSRSDLPQSSIIKQIKPTEAESESSFPEINPLPIDKPFDFRKLNNYKIGIYINLNRNDLFDSAEDIKIQLIKYGFKGIIEINKRDNEFFEEKTFPPKTFEIRYDKNTIEEEISSNLENILKSIYPKKSFQRVSVTNYKNGKVSVSKHFISIFLGP